MLEKILIAGAAVGVLFIALVASRASAYHVERKLAIAAPTGLVFGVLNDLQQFAKVLVLFGSPWEKLDPHMHKTFTGSAAGVGQSLTWRSRKAGQGTMTIEESVPAERVRIKLVFVKPMASTATCTLTLTRTPTGSLVTWSMAGHHNFVGKAMGLFMDMDKLLGADLEMGLALLQPLSEGQPAAMANAAAAQANYDQAAAG